MIEKDLSELYQKVILKHQKQPYHFEKRSQSDKQVEAYNPTCGDQFDLFLTIEDGLILEAWFYGYGCAISKASTSVLTKRLEGKPITELPSYLNQFIKGVSPNEENEKITLEDRELRAFEGAKRFPGRLTCATLAWKSLLEELEQTK